MSEELEGRVIGGYRVKRLIAHGGMGSVYEAIQEKLEKRVALKVLKPELAKEAALLDRLHLEALAAARLDHPHIVDVTDVSLDTKPPFLVMEYIVGWPLTDVFREGPMREQRAAFIMSQVLDALAAAHRAGIVHRDLKPSNVFLTQLAGVKDVVKVLDFGVAHIRIKNTNKRLTEDGQKIGTPAFMSPEQARGAEVDGRSDLFACGLLLYGSVTSRMPFPTNNAADMQLAIQAGVFTPIESHRPDVDPRFVEVVNKAMAISPDDRFQTAEEMLEALKPWAGSDMRAAHKPRTDEMMAVPASRISSIPPKANADFPEPTTGGSSSGGKRKKKRGVAPWLIIGGALLFAMLVAAAILLFGYLRKPAPAPVESPAAATPAGGAARADSRGPGAVPAVVATAGTSQCSPAVLRVTRAGPYADGRELTGVLGAALSNRSGCLTDEAGGLDGEWEFTLAADGAVTSIRAPETTSGLAKTCVSTALERAFPAPGAAGSVAVEIDRACP